VSASPDVLVVGAGIVGAACAEALARDGLRVQVLEASFPASGATSCAMGHVVAMDDSDPQLALTRRGRELWSSWAAELPARCELEPRGTLWVAADGEELSAVAPRAARYRAHGVAAELLDARALREAEPCLRPGLAGGLRVPGDLVLYPPAAARWLLDRAVTRGAAVRSGEAALQLGARRVRTRDGWRDAGAVVLAAGIDSARLLPGLPLAPRKGHLVITERVPDFARHQLVELGYLRSAHGQARASVAFNLQPRATGQVLLGSSREFVGLDGSLNGPLRDRMIRRALEYVPALARLPALRTWVGFRPCTPDNLPLVGRWEPVEGLFVATGHEGLGITTAPATGELVADLVAGRRGPLDPAPFSPMRRMEVAHG